MINPSEELVPRNFDNPELEKLLVKFSETIGEIVDLGAQILYWDANRKVGDDTDIPILLTLRNFLELLDTISILIKSSSIDPCKIILRSLLETSMGIEYLLEKDTENRSMAFLVWHAKNELKFYRKLKPGLQQHKEFQNSISKDKIIGNYKLPNIPILDHAINNLENLLENASYKKAVDEYDNLRSKNEKNPPWYRLFGGPKNIQGLAEYLRLTAFYDVFFRYYSGTVHGTDIIKGKVSGSNESQLEIIQLRNPKNAQIITHETVVLANRTIQIFLKKRLPDKLDYYKNWYLKNRDFYTSLREYPMLKTE